MSEAEQNCGKQTDTHKHKHKHKKIINTPEKTIMKSDSGREHVIRISVRNREVLFFLGGALIISRGEPTTPP